MLVRCAMLVLIVYPACLAAPINFQHTVAALRNGDPLSASTIGTTAAAWRMYCAQLTPTQREELRKHAAYLRRTESSKFVLHTRSSLGYRLREPHIRFCAFFGSLLCIGAGISFAHEVRMQYTLSLAALGAMLCGTAILLPYWYAYRERKILFSIIQACE